MTDQEAVERAADAIRSFQRHRNRDGQRPWEGRPPLEILEAHVGRFDSRVISLARRALQRADGPSA